MLTSITLSQYSKFALLVLLATFAITAVPANLASAESSEAHTSALVAGLSTNYNGDPIGVASDSIFDMVKRRYTFMDKENSFIADLFQQ